MVTQVLARMPRGVKGAVMAVWCQAVPNFLAGALAWTLMHDRLTHAPGRGADPFTPPGQPPSPSCRAGDLPTGDEDRTRTPSPDRADRIGLTGALFAKGAAS
jgi:hypothetical protein